MIIGIGSILRLGGGGGDFPGSSGSLVLSLMRAHLHTYPAGAIHQFCGMRPHKSRIHNYMYMSQLYSKNRIHVDHQMSEPIADE